MECYYDASGHEGDEGCPPKRMSTIARMGHEGNPTLDMAIGRTKVRQQEVGEFETWIREPSCNGILDTRPREGSLVQPPS